MTDAILRAYTHTTSLTQIPFPFTPPVEGALGLLDGETEGWAFDATTYDATANPDYPAGTVAVIDLGTPANDLSNVGLEESNVRQEGTSPKYVHHFESPYLRWSPHNLMRESNTHTTSWTANTDTRTSGQTDPFSGTDAYLHTLTSGTSDFYQVVTTGTGVTYVLRFYWKAGTQGNWIRVSLGSATPAAANAVYYSTASPPVIGTIGVSSGYVSDTVTSMGSGWYRFDIVFAASGSSLGIGVWEAAGDGSSAETSGDNYYLYGFQLNRGATPQTYRVTTTSSTTIGIPHSYDATAGQYAIWIEPAATNLHIQSEDFSAANWNLSQATISANATTAPNALTLADALVDNGTDSEHYVYDQFTGTAVTYTASIYAKKANRNFLVIQMYDGTGITGRAWFDLNTGAVGTVGLGTAHMITIGDGWYRCIARATMAVSAACEVRYGSADTDNDLTYAGSSNAAIYLFGAQVELGNTTSTATSYTQTAAATATRALDNITASSSTFPWDDATGTFVENFRHLRALASITGSTRQMWAVADGSNAWLGQTVATNLYVELAGTGPFNERPTPITNATSEKLGMTFAVNDIAAVLDGGTIQTGTVLTLLSGVTGFWFGDNDGGTAPDHRYVYSFVYLPRRMTNVDLQAATA